MTHNTGHTPDDEERPDEERDTAPRRPARSHSIVRATAEQSQKAQAILSTVAFERYAAGEITPLPPGIVWVLTLHESFAGTDSWLHRVAFENLDSISRFVPAELKAQIEAHKGQAVLAAYFKGHKVLYSGIVELQASSGNGKGASA